MHSLLSRYCFCSTKSNLPSLPKTESMIEDIEFENLRVLEELLLDLEGTGLLVNLVKVKELFDMADVDLFLV